MGRVHKLYARLITETRASIHRFWYLLEVLKPTPPRLLREDEFQKQGVFQKCWFTITLKKLAYRNLFCRYTETRSNIGEKDFFWVTV